MAKEYGVNIKKVSEHGSSGGASDYKVYGQYNDLIDFLVNLEQYNYDYSNGYVHSIKKMKQEVMERIKPM